MRIEKETARMRLLFTMDKKDYSGCRRTFRRDSARGIIFRDGRIAMVHSLKYDYYKFPGGGIEKGEKPVVAMIRETKEESGLAVIPETIREYGYVHRIQKSVLDPKNCFIQDNYYYLCDVEDEVSPQNLDSYEAEESYQLEFIDPLVAIERNRAVRDPSLIEMLEREALVLELLMKEGYFS